MKDQLPIVLFDPECPLCLRFKQGLEHLDRTINFVSSRDDEVYQTYPELNKQDCLEKIHMLTQERKILVGPEVVDHFLHVLPGVSKLAWLLDNEQGRKVKEFFYNKVEELRQLSLKKDEDCNQCPRKD